MIYYIHVSKVRSEKENSKPERMIPMKTILEGYNETEICEVLGIEYRPIMVNIIRHAYIVGVDAGRGEYNVLDESGWSQGIQWGDGSYITVSIADQKATFKKGDLIVEAPLT